MKELKILYLKTNITESVELGQLLVNRLQGKGVIIESYPATAAAQGMILEFLTQYDIIIFDGTIENDAELNNAKYDFLDPSILLRDNFFVVTRNTLPMNIVPPHSNLNQFVALRNSMYQIDKNRFEISVLPGCEKDTKYTIQHILKALDSIEDGISMLVNYVHFNKKDYDCLSMHNGELFASNGIHRLAASNTNSMFYFNNPAAKLDYARYSKLMADTLNDANYDIYKSLLAILKAHNGKVKAHQESANLIFKNILLRESNNNTKNNPIK